MARKSKKGKVAKPKAAKMTREMALRAKPMGVPIVEREEMGHGGAQLTYMIQTKGFSKLVLRLPDEVEKTVELDEVGLQIFDQCDGHTPVSKIIKHYSKTYKVDPHEAEIAVTTFLQNMMHRGMVNMIIPK